MFLFIDDLQDIKHEIIKFKYISCSYLSENTVNSILAQIRFKYISCSYLSIGRTNKPLIIY